MDTFPGTDRHSPFEPDFDLTNAREFDLVVGGLAQLSGRAARLGLSERDLGPSQPSETPQTNGLWRRGWSTQLVAFHPSGEFGPVT